MNALQKINLYLRRYLNLPRQIDDLRQAVGRIELRQTLATQAVNLHANEFKVFSQFGEDGIIQFLIRSIAIERPIFVEFGVQDYTEANTRFLLQHDNWSGLVLDGSPEQVARIQADPVNYRYALTAECAFVTRENINNLLRHHRLTGDIGLLSIDIDGNDYWVWEAIDCIQPRIVIVEYNNWFGVRRKVTVPYSAHFVRGEAHYSHLYYGASLSGLEHLAQRKGYALVGSNSAGNNAFFVRRDVLGQLPACTAAEIYCLARYRESRGPNGQHTFLDYTDSLALIAELPLIDVESGQPLRVKDL